MKVLRKTSSILSLGIPYRPPVFIQEQTSLGCCSAWQSPASSTQAIRKCPTSCPYYSKLSRPCPDYLGSSLYLPVPFYPWGRRSAHILLAAHYGMGMSRPVAGPGCHHLWIYPDILECTGNALSYGQFYHRGYVSLCPSRYVPTVGCATP